MINRLSTEAKILGTIGIITVVLLLGGIIFLAKTQSSSAGPTSSDQVSNIDYSKGQKIGSDSAKLRLVEFSDFQCPACLAFEPTVREILSAKHENFQYIYRYFPLPANVHKNALAASIFGEYAAENGKFWEIHNKLFDTQSQWEGLADPTSFFVGMAKDFGLDETQAKAAFNDQGVRDIVLGDLNEGQSLGVNSTPTFFLNGHRLQLNTVQDLKTAVENGLKQ